MPESTICHGFVLVACCLLGWIVGPLVVSDLPFLCAGCLVSRLPVGCGQMAWRDVDRPWGADYFFLRIKFRMVCLLPLAVDGVFDDGVWYRMPFARRDARGVQKI